ncbi:acyltransferase [Bradyrhizobium sp. AUGA SZCCT0169]|uniref:acyltransferase family protein n=1 Tax=Bradyrhizobium sp. AUGA SZCCT0169 TaxID=2807663 RepID=UPI001BA525B3|nr:acyltransferase [Bradyrhizobium sp. AUGA SZCCT0169]MBR1249458.1 acyltransferase [Bradyrhizobium sp. AUGA SZCCT0169]
MNHGVKFKVDAATSNLMDALRGVSAMIVACVHGFQVFILPYFGVGSPSHILTSLLATHAVTMFFIVSGFMIYVSALRHRNADGSFQSAGFAEARILRIYPPLIAAIFITILVYLTIQLLDLHGRESFRLGGELFVARERATLEWSALPSTFFLLYGAVPAAPPPINMDGPLWTLSYEWWFYILIFLSARLWNGWSFSTLLPLAAVGLMLLYGRNALFLWFFLIWLSGFWLGHIYVKGHLFTDKFWSRAAALAFSALTMMFVLGRGHLASDLLNPFDTPSAQRMMVIVGVFLTLVVSILIRWVTSSGVRIPKAISGWARFSYTLYVIHYPLLLLSFSLLHPLLHNHGWMISLIAVTAVLPPITYIASKVALLVENRRLLSHLVPRTHCLQQKA